MTSKPESRKHGCSFATFRPWDTRCIALRAEQAGAPVFIATQAHDTGDSFVIENANLRVTVNKKSGCITSLFDKRSNFESLATGGCGNQLQFFKDTPKDYDAWNIDPGTLDVPPMVIDDADSVEISDAQSPTPGIRVTRHWQSSKFVQTLSLAPGADAGRCRQPVRLA